MDDMVLVIWLIMVFLISSLLLLFHSSPKKHPPVSRNQKPPSGFSASGSCPICHQKVTLSQKVHSWIYPGTPWKMMKILGCSQCKNLSSPFFKDRHCPLCHIQLLEKDYLIARYSTIQRKNQASIIGCNQCHFSGIKGY